MGESNSEALIIGASSDRLNHFRTNGYKLVYIGYNYCLISKVHNRVLHFNELVSANTQVQKPNKYGLPIQSHHLRQELLRTPSPTDHLFALG